MKKNRNLSYIALTVMIALAVIIAARYCIPNGAATETPPPEVPITEPATQPATEPPTEPATEPATQPPAPTEVPSEAPSIPPQEKPSLAFSRPVEDLGQQIIGFTFPGSSPDSTLAIRAAPLVNIQSEIYTLPTGYGKLTPVGVVEIGPGAEAQQPGIYLVALEVGATGQGVPGRIFQLTEENQPDINLSHDVVFQGIIQKLNPARTNPPFDEFPELNPYLNPPPDISAAIGADGVTFVVKVDDRPTYIRYISQSSELSLKGNFRSQYSNLEASISEAVNRLRYLNNLPPEATVQSDQIISTMEDSNHLDNCREQIVKPAQETPTAETPIPGLEDQNVCGSDITIAPIVQNVAANHPPSRSEFTLAGGRFMIASALASAFQQPVQTQTTVGVVQALQQIDADPDNIHEDNSDIIQPGFYTLTYFYEDQVFKSAKISGIADNGDIVTDQEVPAVPATVVNGDDTVLQGAQVSSCRIFNICTFFQRFCS